MLVRIAAIPLMRPTKRHTLPRRVIQKLRGSSLPLSRPAFKNR